MTTHFRTLLLLGFTGSVALSGCIIETTNDAPNNNSTACLNNQYFRIEWLADTGIGTARLPCASVPRNAVELTLASGTLYVIDGVCDDAFQYNFSGSTQGGVAVGDYVTRFRLLRSDTRAELSPGGVFPGPNIPCGTPANPSLTCNPAMAACTTVIHPYEFPLI